jgi:DNA primase
VRFLNEAEPIMQQINAPRSAMYLRKKVAELAQLSTDEMQSLLKLPNLNKVPAKARPKLTRTAVSLQKRFCLMLLMHPALANQEDLLWIDDHAEEGVLLRQAIEICLQHPHSKLVVLLRELESRVQATVLRELERELSALDETLDLTQELMGARQQLQDAYSHRQQALLLARISEKPLNSLTEDEITLLRSVGSKPSQNRA